ncbi:MAG: sigma-70 family RNA polymerase sigma factor [Acidobacteria bacterium]|nr:sigma-70 family RNA polymerase sigma factor [Acidobacteriota bacterium]
MQPDPSPTAAAPLVDPRAWLQDNFEQVRTVVARVARRRRVPAEDREEILSRLCAHLTRDDYRVLRGYRGDSRVHTYIAVVAERLLLDWRTAHWGKWRPSAEARRLGPQAVQFERLVRRDGHSADEAHRMLHEATGARLEPALAEHLVARGPHVRRRFIDIDRVRLIADHTSDPWAALIDQQRDRCGRRLGQCLERVVRRLPAADQVLLRMRHEQGLRVSQIAAMLGTDPKRLYRRLSAIHADLCAALTALGVSPGDVVEVVGRPSAHVPRVLHRATRVV